jgi:hypothetical protein
MYFPAMTALRFNSAVKAFGDRLKERGKEKMVVIGAAMRKPCISATGCSNPVVPSTLHSIRRPDSALVTLDIHHSIFFVSSFN